MSELIYPTLDLFVYHGRNAGGDEEKDIQQNQENFSANFPTDNLPDFSRENKADSLEYLKLWDEQFFPDKINEDKYVIQESYYPVLLSDTYGLLYSSSVEDEKNTQPVDCLQTLKKIALKKQGNIGKTWIISGYLPHSSERETVAESAYKAAFVSGRWQQRQRGKFIGADIFEVWQPPQMGKSLEDSHVLIIIFPSLAEMQKLGKFSNLWMQLFCFRNKIVWAYEKTRYYKQELQNVYKSIRQTIDKVKTISGGSRELSPEQLNQLQEILKTNIADLYDYANNLSYLEMYLQTLEVNLHNYEETLTNLTNKAIAQGDTNLNFLTEFINIVKQKYCKQIEKDSASLSPGLRVLENLISTIRGIVEIEQAESDRAFQETLEINGLGLAVAAIAASAISPFMEKLTQPLAISSAQTSPVNPPSRSGFLPVETLPLLNLVLTVFISIGVGLWAKSRTRKWVESRRQK